MTLDIDEDAKNFLCATGYSPVYGASPLDHTIKNYLLNPLSVMILSGQVCDGETIKVTFDDLRKRLVIAPNHEGTAIDNDSVDSDDEDSVDWDGVNRDKNAAWPPVNAAGSFFQTFLQLSA